MSGGISVGNDDGGFLKKFLDKSVIFDVIVIGVLALDAYLLQQTAGTFGRASITSFPPPSIDILAAQATAGLIFVKIVNAMVDSSD
ncbi:hypothetical protein [Candidatus Nanohalococcus occultus]|uniref:Uncharacterized protein n=1 Tax=Candidatus Nanohalococcus occultus TaxID=2978047 RepID=A0ABY8CI55_9ARCH|nr:hypothetical protein SVXNc_0317 [Candidatus Nanohaloarchaeota archaeon SVXNc]